MHNVVFAVEKYVRGVISLNNGFKRRWRIVGTFTDLTAWFD